MSIWSISICGFDYRLKMSRNKGLSSETRQSILVLRNKGYSMPEIAKKLKISYNPVYYSLHRTAQTSSNQNRKRSGRPRCTTVQEEKYIRVASLRNRHLPSPQLAASLNSTHQNTSLNINIEEVTPGCWPSRQSCKEKAISQTGQ